MLCLGSVRGGILVLRALLIAALPLECFTTPYYLQGHLHPPPLGLVLGPHCWALSWVISQESTAPQARFLPLVLSLEPDPQERPMASFLIPVALLL